MQRSFFLDTVHAIGLALPTGYNFNPYDPLCAESCLRSLSSYMLSKTLTLGVHAQ